MHGQILAGDDAQPHAQALQHDGSQAGQHHHKQQLIAELRAALDRRGPVAGVHIADRDQVAGADKAEEAAPPRAVLAYGHAALAGAQFGADDAE